MLRFVPAAVMAVFLCLPAVSCDDFDATTEQMESDGVAITVVDSADLEAFAASVSVLSGATYVGATRAFIASTSTGFSVGIEIASCLLPPIRIQKTSSGPGVAA